ncbi:MAG: purine-binding chemotaxis protein CheW [Chloroflexi bacterium]|jgi:purine-binding chemotaxis protein CheW|nr:purine-binding chemotaxis protein CheW [Chloroflexota bacterium]
MSSSSTSLEQQLVIFTLSNESYGVDIAKVSGIERMHEVTRVPRTPEFVQGVINLRGRVIPVVHLRRLFNLPEGDVTKETRIVVVDIGGQPIGIQVDEVTEVLTIATDSIDPASAVITSADSDYLLGIAKLDDKLVILLDLEKVLSVNQTSQLSKVTSRDSKEVPNTVEVNTSEQEVEAFTDSGAVAEFEEELSQELESPAKPKTKAKKSKNTKKASSK